MGYTNYFTRFEDKHDAGRFRRFVEDVRRAFANLPEHVRLADGNGFGEPVITDEMVCFNGRAEYNNDMSHETMLIERDIIFRDDDYGKRRQQTYQRKGEIFCFCKTQRKPYDFAVQVVLILYKHYFGSAVFVHSDGDQSDWFAACEFVKSLFGLIAEYDGAKDGLAVTPAGYNGQASEIASFMG